MSCATGFSWTARRGSSRWADGGQADRGRRGEKGEKEVKGQEEEEGGKEGQRERVNRT